jgi:DNA-binding transcriptional regulator YiaG
MNLAMNRMLFIRETVFGCETQADFAKLLGVSQGTVSKWEGGAEPGYSAMALIREKARKKRIPWNDSWFFEKPTEMVA